MPPTIGARARPVLFLSHARNLYFRAERITFRYARIARFPKQVHVMLITRVRNVSLKPQP